MMRTPSTASAPSDLRTVDCSPILEHVQRALNLRLDEDSLIHKRRTVSARTSRNTWLRVEARTAARVTALGWGGVETAAALTGIAKPDWYRSVSWHDPVHKVWWRADETQFVTDSSVTAGGTLRRDPALPDRWWATLRDSLAALADQPAPRAAKLLDATADQQRIRALAGRACAGLGVAPIDAQVDQWVSAHGDLTWANLTAPKCLLLDWEDWGRAPRGLDPATLLLGSLTIPTLAHRIQTEFAGEPTSQSGRITTLALTAELLEYPGYAGPLLQPARHVALHAATALRRDRPLPPAGS
jgi:hypothetical protein